MEGQESSKQAMNPEQVKGTLAQVVQILGAVTGVVEKTLATVTDNPELLQGVLRPVGEAVGALGKTVGQTVPELGQTLGKTVGGTVSQVGDTVGQTVGAVSDVGKPLGGIVESLGQALGGLGGKAAARPEAGGAKQELVRQIEKNLMNRSTEELQAIFKALESKRAA